MDNLEQKQRTLAAMAENFGKPMSSDLQKLWLKMLAPYSAGQVDAGITKVLFEYTYKTLPPFAVLRQAIEEAAGLGKVDAKTSALAEWNWLLDTIASRGSYRGEPEDMHPTTAAVVRSLGGWSACCLWTSSALEFRRKDFLEAWERIDGKGELMALGAAGMAAALPEHNANAFSARLTALKNRALKGGTL